MLQLEKLVINYLEICKYQKNLSQKTLKAYKIDFQQFLDYMKGTDGNLNKINLSNYITYLHKTYKPKTIKRKLASLKAFCNYLEYDEVIQKDPFSKIKVKFQEPFLLSECQRIFEPRDHEYLNHCDNQKLSHNS